MSDGANLNIRADRALETVVGGKEQPTVGDGVMSDEQFKHMVRNAQPGGDYGEQANYCARRILEFWEAHPEHVNTPCENVYAEGAWRAYFEGGGTGTTPTPTERGLYDVLKDHAWGVDKLDLTGFMWGWAFNAARHIQGLPPVPNPAIIEIG